MHKENINKKNRGVITYTPTMLMNLKVCVNQGTTRLKMLQCIKNVGINSALNYFPNDDCFIAILVLVWKEHVGVVVYNSKTKYMYNSAGILYLSAKCFDIKI
jgi:hypothetical protein